MNKLLTITEAAAYTGRHRQTIKLWVLTGKLKGAKLSTRGPQSFWTIPLTSLDAHLANIAARKGGSRG